MFALIISSTLIAGAGSIIILPRESLSYTNQIWPRRTPATLRKYSARETHRSNPQRRRDNSTTPLQQHRSIAALQQGSYRQIWLVPIRESGLPRASLILPGFGFRCRSIKVVAAYDDPLPAGRHHIATWYLHSYLELWYAL
ncbi:hypothetical protein CIHG_00571 [Coccidioides immitis H538.4]|uniref:Uncharacterized protein n=1 Tax=Coccidioides immitis H538.4 TaxID=396776 RepID=A0A0J8U6Y2_COCIT|nr:hypothetical protein CIHG_00571 [Coccidioides immitis H538.4]